MTFKPWHVIVLVAVVMALSNLPYWFAASDLSDKSELKSAGWGTAANIAAVGGLIRVFMGRAPKE